MKTELEKIEDLKVVLRQLDEKATTGRTIFINVGDAELCCRPDKRWAEKTASGYHITDEGRKQISN